jgi:hypothetical protein
VSTQATLWTDLRLRLNDPNDTQFTKAQKMAMLNSGMAAMWPRIYRVVRDSTLALIADTFEYEIPTTYDGGKLLQVEVETANLSGRYGRSVPYWYQFHPTAPYIQFDQVDIPREAGSKIRLTMAMPLTPFTESTNGTETYTGPAGTEELPVLYAMGIAAAVPLDDRLDHNKYSTVNVLGNPQPVDMMTASQFWFAQFELMLERWALPMPVLNG